MAQTFKETAHLNTDEKELAKNWTHIFDKKNCDCETCKPNQSNSQPLPSLSSQNPQTDHK